MKGLTGQLEILNMDSMSTDLSVMLMLDVMNGIAHLQLWYFLEDTD